VKLKIIIPFIIGLGALFAILKEYDYKFISIIVLIICTFLVGYNSRKQLNEIEPDTSIGINLPEDFQREEIAGLNGKE